MLQLFSIFFLFFCSKFPDFARIGDRTHERHIAVFARWARSCIAFHSFFILFGWLFGLITFAAVVVVVVVEINITVLYIVETFMCSFNAFSSYCGAVIIPADGGGKN